MEFLPALLLWIVPAYLVRFSVLGINTNVLMLGVVAFWLLFLFYLRSSGIKKFIDYCRALPKLALVLVLTFFVAGIVSFFVAGVSVESLGQFIVLFVQPISLFFCFTYIFKNYPKSKVVFRASAFMLVALSGLLAIFQYITLISLPQQFWGNMNEPKRAISFFAQPDMYAMFVAPLLAWLLGEVLGFLKKPFDKGGYFVVGAWIIGAIGLFLSLSRGGWIGLGAAGVLALIFNTTKQQRKIIYIASVICIAIVFSVPNFRYRVILPFLGEKSAVSRFSLWDNGIKMIKESPVIGKGLLGFNKNFDRVNTDPGLDHHNHPHNLFLALWVDTGVIGVLSFYALVLFGIYQSFKLRKDPKPFGLALFLVAIIIHGLVDTPYLKNDLAMIFWIIYSYHA